MRRTVVHVSVVLALLPVLACENGATAGRFTSDSTGQPNPVAPARAPVALPGSGSAVAEALTGRALDPFSVPPDLDADRSGLVPSTVSLPVDETYGGTAGFAFRITQEGVGNGGWFRVRNQASANRMALLATHTGEGIAARAINTGRGRAFWAQIPEASNPFPALVTTHVGSGEALEAIQFGSGDAIVARTTGIGHAGRFVIDNSSSGVEALEVTSNGNGATFLARASGNGRAGLFQITDPSSTEAGAIIVSHLGTGDIAVFVGGLGGGGANVRARITNDGDILADGTITGGGADLAESFDVVGSPADYAPGDVVAIATDHRRRVEKSAEAYSTRVIGVYATDPGVVLGESVEGLSGERIPVAVTGVVPTKVTAENGSIRSGDILVGSNRAGYAMKGEPVMLQGRAIYPTGAVIGKALEPFDGPGAGTILVMVNVK